MHLLEKHLPSNRKGTKYVLQTWMSFSHRFWSEEKRFSIFHFKNSGLSGSICLSWHFVLKKKYLSNSHEFWWNCSNFFKTIFEVFKMCNLPDSFSYEVWQATTTLFYKTTPLSAKANIIILSINAWLTIDTQMFLPNNEKIRENLFAFTPKNSFVKLKWFT